MPNDQEKKDGEEIETPVDTIAENVDAVRNEPAQEVVDTAQEVIEEIEPQEPKTTPPERGVDDLFQRLDDLESRVMSALTPKEETSTTQPEATTETTTTEPEPKEEEQTDGQKIERTKGTRKTTGTTGKKRRGFRFRGSKR